MIKTRNRAYERRLITLRARRDAAYYAIVNAALTNGGTMTHRFSDMRKLVGNDLNSALDDVDQAIRAFEDDMIAQGRAYRARFGALTFYA